MIFKTGTLLSLSLLSSSAFATASEELKSKLHDIKCSYIERPTPLTEKTSVVVTKKLFFDNDPDKDVSRMEVDLKYKKK